MKTRPGIFAPCRGLIVDAVLLLPISPRRRRW